MEEKTEISVLNDYALIAIFEKLNPQDLYSAQQVCQQWKELVKRCWATRTVLDFSGCFEDCEDEEIFDPPLYPALMILSEEPMDKCPIFFPHIHKAKLQFMSNKPMQKSKSEKKVAIFDFHEILEHAGMNVRIMDLSAIAHLLGDMSIHVIGNVCHNLAILDLSGSCTYLFGLTNIAENCQNLKEVVLNNCYSLDDYSLAGLLFSGTKLTHLDISFNEHITGKCFVFMGPNLSALKMIGCNEVDQYGFEQIGMRCSGLTELRIDDCTNITNEGLRAICQGCKELRVLSISGEDFRHLGFGALDNISELRQLRELYLANNEFIDNNSLLEISSGCLLLEVLDLYNCGTAVSDAGLESFRSCANLRSIDIGYLPNVTNRTLITLAKVGLLEEVKIWGNDNLCNEYCRALLTQCPCLRLLDLSSCTSIDSDVLHSCLQAVAGRETGPQLVVVIDGSSIDDDHGFDHLAHPLLHIVNDESVLLDCSE